MHTKTSSLAKPPRPFSRATASHCVIVNQLATPGLGSLLARRWIAGTGQLLLAVTGFGLIMLWFYEKMRELYMLWQEQPAPPAQGAFGKTGLALFVLAWLWAGVTSLSLLKQARRMQSATPPTLA
jgi:hypothetical protein